MRQKLGQRQPQEQGDRPTVERGEREESSSEPLEQLDCPTDWSMIHISLTRQALSIDQQLAIIRLAQWVPRPDVHEARSPEPRGRHPREDGTTEERIKRTKDLLERVPHPAMAVHIRREELPSTEWRRSLAAERIDEVLAVFPADQIQIRTEGQT